MHDTAQRIEIKRKGRHYQVRGVDEPLVSITNVQGVINKPGLIYWAANTERELVINTAADLNDLINEVGDDKKIQREAYIALLKDRLGQTKAHQRQLAKAAEIGTQAHSLIEWTVRNQLELPVGPEPKVSDKAMWAFMAWEDWAKKVELVPISVEHIVWCIQCGYAGTMDLFAEFTYGGARVTGVLDWKTSKAIYRESYMQAAALAHAYDSRVAHIDGGKRLGICLHGVIVRLPKNEDDPEFEAHVLTPEEMNGHFEAFLAAKKLWEWANG